MMFIFLVWEWTLLVHSFLFLIRIRGRLAKCISEWEGINARGFTLEVIREGYKIPFVSLPPPKHSDNNLSAIKEKDFVSEAVLDLLKMNCIEELDEAPDIVNPLSVSTQSSGKKRLILGLRHVNLYVYKQKNFFRFLLSNCLNWKIYCDDHTSLSSTTAVQI